MSRLLFADVVAEAQWIAVVVADGALVEVVLLHSTDRGDTFLKHLRRNGKVIQGQFLCQRRVLTCTVTSILSIPAVCCRCP